MFDTVSISLSVRGILRLVLPPLPREERFLLPSLSRERTTSDILYNEEPLGIHEELNEEVTEGVRELVKETTYCYERDEVREIGIEFYRFDQALVDIYDLMYKESERGNDVLVNVSGGTKPVAIALAYCCSIVDSGIPMYYVAEDYTEDDSQGEASSTGVVETPYEVSPLQALDLSDLLPTDETKETILLELSEQDCPIGVKDMLVNAGIITDQVPEDENEEQERRDTLSKYHRVIRNIYDDNIVDKTDSKYFLTDSGDLIARLVETRQSAERELGEE